MQSQRGLRPLGDTIYGQAKGVVAASDSLYSTNNRQNGCQVVVETTEGKLPSGIVDYVDPTLFTVPTTLQLKATSSIDAFAPFVPGRKLHLNKGRSWGDRHQARLAASATCRSITRTHS